MLRPEELDPLQRVPCELPLSFGYFMGFEARRKLTRFNLQSNLAIEDVYFKNFKGVTSGKYDPKVGTIVCSSPDVSI